MKSGRRDLGSSGDGDPDLFILDLTTIGSIVGAVLVPWQTLKPIEHVEMVLFRFNPGQKRILYRTFATKLSQTPSLSSFVNFHHRGTEGQ